MGASLFAQVLLSGILQGGVYALMASGLSMTLGVMRVVDLGYGVYYMLGSYVAFSLVVLAGAPYWVAIVAAPAAVFLVGMILEHLFVRKARKDELRVMILTLAGAYAIEEAARFIWGPTWRDLPPMATGTFRLGPVLVERQRVIALLVSVVVLTALLLALKRTRLGMAVRMVAQDWRSALLLGIHVDAIQRLTFATGAALAALAGTLLAPLYVLYPAMGWDPLMRAFATVILGGIGSLSGTILAGLLLGVVELFTSFYVSPAVSQLAIFLLLVVIIVTRPAGLQGLTLRR